MSGHRPFRELTKGFTPARRARAAAKAAALREEMTLEELRKALTIPEVSKGLEAIGELKPTTPEEMHDRVAGELKMWIKIVDEAKIPKQ